MSTKENEIQDRVILVDGEPPSDPQAGVWFAFVDKLLKTKDSGGNIDTYPKIEHGSDVNNGDWMKLYLTEYTGILVCWDRKTLDKNVATTAGDYQPALTDSAITWTHPQTFDGTAHTYAFAETTDTGSGDGIGHVVSDRNADGDFGYRIYWLTGTATGWNRWIYLLAIGTFDDTP